MPAVRPNRIEMIPISQITILNPRARNKRQHREIVNNIEAIGLKRPITVSRRDGAGGPRYDLVCGEGRLRQMSAVRQIEAADLMIGQNNFSIMFARAIRAATPESLLIVVKKGKRAGTII
jgi:ParB family chromosome partitioning protein